MNVPKLLEAASLLVPEEIATENDITVNDVWEYLSHDEWEVALDLLEELGDVHPLPLSFWQALATAAEQMRLERSAAWCHWRCYETRHGVIRADLTLRPAGEARRQTPFSGAGVLQPMWNIGNRTPTVDQAPRTGVLRLYVPEACPFSVPPVRVTAHLLAFLESIAPATVLLLICSKEVHLPLFRSLHPPDEVQLTPARFNC
jgi:hypothetical protein